YRASRARDYRRFCAAAQEIVAEGMEATGLSEKEYMWRHMRMLTVTTASPEYMAGGHYSVMEFRLRLKDLTQELQRRLFYKTGSGPGPRLEYWLQVEPQGMTAHFRLHVHLLLFNVPDDMLVWHGPDSKARPGRKISLERWLEEIESPPAGARPSFARWLVRTGFWLLSDCQRVKNWRGALDYVSKEMNTSDMGGEPSAVLLDWIFMDEAVGRRIRSVRYTGAFYGVLEDPEDLTELGRFRKRVPLWELKGVVRAEQLDEHFDFERGPLLDDDQVMAMSTAALREAMGWLMETSRESVAAYLERFRLAGRERERWRKARDEYLRGFCGRSRKELELALKRPPRALGELKGVADGAARAAREYRDWLGMPCWLSYQSGFLARYVDRA
ncbi:MAG: hypothetical protein OXE50_13805, partial [Chloroflexi bacterium]|nr:hypothetical protein [Chloroflexota bacterium]